MGDALPGEGRDEAYSGCSVAYHALAITHIKEALRIARIAKEIKNYRRFFYPGWTDDI